MEELTLELLDEILNDYSQIIADEIEGAVKEWSKDVLKIEQKMLNEVLKIQQSIKLNADGTISMDNDIMELMAKFDEAAEKLSREPTFVNDVRSFISNLDDINKNAANIHKKANKIDIYSNDDLMKMLTKQQQFIADKTYYDLGQGGMKEAFNKQAKRLTLEAATMGLSQKQLQRNYEASLISTGQNDSYYMRYSVQITRDTAAGTAGQIHQLVADQYEMDGIRYVGSLLKDSRPFCEHVRKTLNGRIKVSELEALLDRYEDTSGMKPDTQVGNFYTVRGGFNCRHQAIPYRI